MLVLMRTAGEKIVIGEDIILTVCEIRGRQVRLGIEAPEEIVIRRAELPDRKERSHERDRND